MFIYVHDYIHVHVCKLLTEVSLLLEPPIFNSLVDGLKLC